MEPEIILGKKKKGALSSMTETDSYDSMPDFVKKALLEEGFDKEKLAGLGNDVSKKTGHITDADSGANKAAGVTPDTPEGVDKSRSDKDPTYQDPEAPARKKSKAPSISAPPTARGSNPNSKRSGEGDAKRQRMMNDWLSQRRDTNFNKYRGPKSYTGHSRPRGILSS